MIDMDLANGSLIHAKVNIFSHSFSYFFDKCSANLTERFFLFPRFDLLPQQPSCRPVANLTLLCLQKLLRDVEAHLGMPKFRALYISNFGFLDMLIFLNKYGYFSIHVGFFWVIGNFNCHKCLHLFCSAIQLKLLGHSLCHLSPSCILVNAVELPLTPI